jgi:hypothetical protein
MYVAWVGKKQDTAMNFFIYFDSQKPCCKIRHVMIIHSAHDAITSCSMKNINTNYNNGYISILWKLVWDHLHAT